MATIVAAMDKLAPCTTRSRFLGISSLERKNLASPRRWRCKAVMAMDSSWMDGLVLGVGVGLPCSVMECGDVLYRSTLPKASSLQVTGPGAALALLAVAYLWATPGVAPGFWDMFVLAPLERWIRPSYTKKDLILGKKIGEGAFGTVYKASFADLRKKGPLVVKKCSEYGEVEAWMNQRVRRACSKYCASYIDGFKRRTRQKKEYWLIWHFEGDATLADFMSGKDFPYNVEAAMGLKKSKLPRGVERERKIIQALMQQLLDNVNRLHETGIVHRDIKPQNIIFSEEAKRFKIIDLGAAADLRVGINYVPKEFLLDPRYAAPEQYIMSTQTPSAPSPPIATALSPVLWRMNLPDRFDVYSLGLIFLQMAFANLRSDSALITFNRQLKRLNHDLVAWRKLVEARPNPDIQRGFQILDSDRGAGWELLQAMMRFKGRQRLSAKAAAGHPYFVKLGLLSDIQRLWLRFVLFAREDKTEWVIGLMAKSGTEEVGGFTEAQLEEMRQREPKKKKDKATLQRNALASALKIRRKVQQTIGGTMEELDKKQKKVWWMNTLDESLDSL